MSDIYYLTFILLALLGIRANMGKRKSIIIATIPLLIIAIFRYGVGADYFSYKYIYTSSIGKSFSDIKISHPDIDSGYLLLGIPFQILGISYEVYFSIITVLILLFILKWIYDNSENIPLSLMVYYSMFFFVWNLSAIRQGLVISLSLFLVFNNKSKLSFIAKMLVIFLLCFIHSSAVLLFFIVLISNLKYTKKIHLVLLGLSIVLAFMPLNSILVYFDFIPGIERFLSYISEGKNPLDFSGLSRLVIYFSVFFNYDRLMKEEKNKKIVNLFLVGIALYFVMSVSQVAAARFGIYTFTFLIIIFPQIVKTYNSNLLMKRLSMLALVLFSTLFLFKELDTMVDQTGLVLTSRYVPFTHQFNKDKYIYNTTYFEFTQRWERANADYLDFNSKVPAISNKVVEAKSEDNFTLVNDREKNEYLILNQKGERVSYKTFNIESSIYKNYVKYKEELTDQEYRYHNILTSEEVIDLDIIYEIEVESQKSYDIVRTIEMSFEELPYIIKSKFLFPEEAENIRIDEYIVPMSHFVVRMDYSYSSIFFMLNENFELLFDDYYYDYNYAKFDSSGFFVAEGSSTREYYYQDGTRVWMVRR